MSFGLKFKEVPELFEAVHLSATPYAKPPFGLDNTDTVIPWYQDLIDRGKLVAIYHKNDKFWHYEFLDGEDGPVVLEPGIWMVKAQFRRGLARIQVYSNEIFLEKFESAES